MSTCGNLEMATAGSVQRIAAAEYAFAASEAAVAADAEVHCACCFLQLTAWDGCMKATRAHGNCPGRQDLPIAAGLCRCSGAS